MKEHFNVSVYMPCKENQRILKKNLNYVIYAHTHNGNRCQGLDMVEQFIKQDIGFVTFDFRANGYSTGQYVTLGYLECIDLNSLVKFLKQKVRANLICLWGRSMGAVSIIYFLSNSFRKRLASELFAQTKRKI